MEQEIINEIKNRIIKDIKETRLLEHHCRAKLKLPDDLPQKVYDSLDWDEIIQSCIGDIQNRICAVVVDSILTEIKTDTKKILAVEGVRQKLRMEAYPKIMEALGDDK